MLECRQSRQKLLGLLAAFAVPSLPTVLIVAWAQVIPGARALLWECLNTYTIGLVFVGWFVARQRKKRLVINQEGICDERLPYGVVEWSDIESIKFYEMYGVEMMGLSVADPAKYLSRASWLYRSGARSSVKAGNPPLSFSLSPFDKTVDEIRQAVEEYCPGAIVE